MPREIQPAGDCPKCNQPALACAYNHFEREELVIDAWEHKCANCGFRDTIAYRSDEPDSLPDDGVTDHCPYCGRKGEPG